MAADPTDELYALLADAPQTSRSRIYNALRREGVSSPQDLTDWSAADLMEIRSLGRSGVAWIEKGLRGLYGWSLRTETRLPSGSRWASWEYQEDSIRHDGLVIVEGDVAPSPALEALRVAYQDWTPHPGWHQSDVIAYCAALVAGALGGDG
jgi:hypothetical protein